MERIILKCCICGNPLTEDDRKNGNIGYDTIEKKVFYRHTKCLLEADAIFDEPENESEQALFIFTDQKVNGAEIGE